MATTRAGAVHWASNLLCAVDLETSGTDPDNHDILQICILPLRTDLEPDTRFIPFYMEMQPQKPKSKVAKDAMRTNGLDWDHLYETALDPWKASELLESWWEGLKLPFRKSIIPLAHNWPFENKFLHSWLGPAAMDHYFFQFRDTMAFANALNDIADFNNEPYPYPKTNLEYLCSQLKIENTNAHDALGDCIATAACYKAMIKRHTLL